MLCRVTSNYCIVDASAADGWILVIGTHTEATPV